MACCCVGRGSHVNDPGSAGFGAYRSRTGPAAVHGLRKINEALRAHGVELIRERDLSSARGEVVIVAGLDTGQGPAARLVRSERIEVPVEEEGILIRRLRLGSTSVLLICSADDRGLMYGELEVADRIGWAEDTADPLREVRDTVEHPYVRDRAVSIYTMQKRYFESRLHDPEHWARYFDLLAKNRFNRVVVIFGYENGGYMAPPYPYFFDVPGFDDVQVVGLATEEQQRNLEALRRMIEMAHARGIEFTAAIWDHIYRGGVQTGGIRKANAYVKAPIEGLVRGVTQDNLMQYSVAAVKALLSQLPTLDSIQFRMHGESGLKREEMTGFWREIYQAVTGSRREIRFDARAKNFPDSLIDLALEMGVNLRICTKYWMEQMGLPFHPTHIHPGNQNDRRHGYADLLRYPKRYKIHWRLWNGGTTRILLWGDPEYARRFAGSTHLYDGDGFEINEPLATKMEAQPHDAEPFDLLKPELRYYDYEFERYWHFFQAFGRMGYNPDTAPETWNREFERRFGKEAGPLLERALHRASWILPMAVTYCYPYRHFPHHSRVD